MAFERIKFEYNRYKLGYYLLKTLEYVGREDKDKAEIYSVKGAKAVKRLRDLSTKLMPLSQKAKDVLSCADFMETINTRLQNKDGTDKPDDKTLFVIKY